ncbi:MAG: DUF1295 domain-containing protein [Chitinophagales bacterium]|nr:DUF1295 domain-containing protein [Chitinophagales bacterium]MDW8273552.1 DUF1295 domain-containing protein [Chitinophagales bacterium]
MQVSKDVLNYCAAIWAGFAILLLPVLLKYKAPYGRHISFAWGKTISNRFGWIVMEIVSPLVLVLCFFSGFNGSNLFALSLVAIWVIHYFHRSVIFPLYIRTTGKRIPIAVVGMAVFFNVINGSLNGLYLGHFQTEFPREWPGMCRLILGFALLIAGAYINIRSDYILIRLRKPGETLYKIPQGFLFRFVSCPNHLGEMIEWVGFAIMAWNLPALSFAVWTIANLMPRALHHHSWYKKHFPDYPKERKALFPFLI